ncbi:MAG: hypothetical protein JW836_13275, partial [Deltaproteobacteria bacterium]|nr:hypothetical protein [Deltaproteobacteria bacterium]
PEPRKKDMSLSKVILPKTDTQFMRHDTRRLRYLSSDGYTPSVRKAGKVTSAGVGELKKLATVLGMMEPHVGYAVSRGERIMKLN